MEILNVIDDLEEELLFSEMEVMDSLLASYDKALLVLEQSELDDYSSFDIFTESFIMESKRKEEKKEAEEAASKQAEERAKETKFRKFNENTGKRESIIKSILMAFPRLIQIIFNSIKKCFSKKKMDDVKNTCKNLEEDEMSREIFGEITEQSINANMNRFKDYNKKSVRKAKRDAHKSEKAIRAQKIEDAQILGKYAISAYNNAVYWSRMKKKLIKLGGVVVAGSSLFYVCHKTGKIKQIKDKAEDIKQHYNDIMATVKAFKGKANVLISDTGDAIKQVASNVEAATKETIQQVHDMGVKAMETMNDVVKSVIATAKAALETLINYVRELINSALNFVNRTPKNDSLDNADIGYDANSNVLTVPLSLKKWKSFIKVSNEFIDVMNDQYKIGKFNKDTVSAPYTKYCYECKNADNVNKDDVKYKLDDSFPKAVGEVKDAVEQNTTRLKTLSEKLQKTVDMHEKKNKSNSDGLPEFVIGVFDKAKSLAAGKTPLETIIATVRHNIDINTKLITSLDTLLSYVSSINTLNDIEKENK